MINDTLSLDFLYFITTLKKGDKVKPKSRLEYTTTEIERVAKNYGALNILLCYLDSNEFNHVCACEIVKEVYDTLLLTYEGIIQVCESKNNLNVH